MVEADAVETATVMVPVHPLQIQQQLQAHWPPQVWQQVQPRQLQHWYQH